MSNNGMVKEAQSIIKGIRQFQSTATDRLANVDKQIEDLKKEFVEVYIDDMNTCYLVYFVLL